MLRRSALCGDVDCVEIGAHLDAVNLAILDVNIYFVQREELRHGQSRRLVVCTGWHARARGHAEG